MLVDLARNDLGRVCEPGHRRGRQAARGRALLAHHAPRLAGRGQAARRARTRFSLLEATFPAGTVSGAPKVRAMQIISEIEGTRRGVYAGAIGYVGYDGAVDTCIAPAHDRDARRARAAAGRRRHRRRLGARQRAPGVPATRSRRSAPRSTSPRRAGTGDDGSMPAIRPSERRRARAQLLLVDNYDSFTYNLAHLLLRGGRRRRRPPPRRGLRGGGRGARARRTS